MKKQRLKPSKEARHEYFLHPTKGFRRKHVSERKKV